MFYLFGSKLLSSAFQAQPMGLKSKIGKNELFDQYRLLKGDYEDIHLPVNFKQVGGEKKSDILDTGWSGLFLISLRFKSVLENNKLSGWSTYPIELKDKKGKLILDYYGFSIIGRCGKFDDGKSKLIKKRIVPNGPLMDFKKGLFFDINNWDGSDLFLSEDYFGTLVTGKAADIFKENNVSNLNLQKLSDVEMPIFH